VYFTQIPCTPYHPPNIAGGYTGRGTRAARLPRRVRRQCGPRVNATFRRYHLGGGGGGGDGGGGGVAGGVGSGSGGMGDSVGGGGGVGGRVYALAAPGLRLMSNVKSGVWGPPPIWQRCVLPFAVLPDAAIGAACSRCYRDTAFYGGNRLSKLQAVAFATAPCCGHGQYEPHVAGGRELRVAGGMCALGHGGSRSAGPLTKPPSTFRETVPFRPHVAAARCPHL
jgi:hypothetical protein